MAMKRPREMTADELNAMPLLRRCVPYPHLPNMSFIEPSDLASFTDARGCINLIFTDNLLGWVRAPLSMLEKISEREANERSRLMTIMEKKLTGL